MLPNMAVVSGWCIKDSVSVSVSMSVSVSVSVSDTLFEM